MHSQVEVCTINFNVGRHGAAQTTGREALDAPRKPALGGEPGRGNL